MEPYQQQTGAQQAIKILDELLRGEISAAETYKQALDKVRDSNKPEANDVRAIELQHGEAIKNLRRFVVESGGKPSDHSGPWGIWAKAVEGTAKLFGDAAALKALKEGEEHGKKLYERAISDPNLPGAARDYLRNTLLPQTRTHITKLDQLIAKN